MDLKKLEEQLNDSVEGFKKESLFTVDSFDQAEYSQDEMKETLEQMSRQTFYVLNEIKSSLLEYLKENEQKG